MSTPSLGDIKSNESLSFDPQTAKAIAQHCNSAYDSFTSLKDTAQKLADTGSAGNFDTAGKIQRGLNALGDACINAVDGLGLNAQQLGDAVRAAGLRIQTQDEQTSAALRSTSDKAADYPPVGQPSSGAFDCRPSDPTGKDAFLGHFPCAAGSETAPGGGVIDWGYGNSQPADVTKLTTLVENWMSLARDIAATASALNAGISGVLANGTWTGTAAEGVRAGSRSVADIATSTGKNAFVNANVVAGWVAAVIGTRTGFEGLKSRLEAENFSYTTAVKASGLSPALVQSHQTVVNGLDQQGRAVIDSTYNPGATKTSSSLLNLPDPGSPIGTIMPMGFSRPANGGGTSSTGTSAAGSGAGAGRGGAGGGGGGSGPGPACNRTGSDAAQSLSRQGSGDPAGAAKNAAAQSGQAGNPASAAQSAMSKAGDTAKGLGGKSGA
ncbi:hypothetical protein, partial [Williamsia phyllosphaerae]|uniref:hypothetical protein n=1 Tax=Williamsia phyllosphaerae TaxID=885042 RepID=UPI003530653D